MQNSLKIIDGGADLIGRSIWVVQYQKTKGNYWAQVVLQTPNTLKVRVRGLLKTLIKRVLNLKIDDQDLAGANIANIYLRRRLRNYD